jgi:hypothetical protein
VAPQGKFREKRRGGGAIGNREGCVFLRTREPNLPIVRRWELLESVFLSFSKKNKDGEEK